MGVLKNSLASSLGAICCVSSLEQTQYIAAYLKIYVFFNRPTMKVSVIIPAFNRLEMLLRAVDSVLKQSFNDFELTVVDDGSDQDLSLIKEHVESAGHSFISTKQSGVAAARNRGVTDTSYEWLAFLDSDDYWLPEKLKAQVVFHLSNPEINISQCQEIWYRDDVRVNQRESHAMPDGDGFNQSLKLCCVSSSSVMLRRELFNAFDGFNEKLTVCEDYDLWLRIASRELFGLIPERLVVKHGGHPDQLSKKYPAMDRFRLVALLNLLSSNLLSNEQQELTLREAARKTMLLAKGAKKHNPDFEPIYLQIGNSLEENDYSSLSELKELILRSLPV